MGDGLNEGHLGVHGKWKGKPTKVNFECVLQQGVWALGKELVPGFIIEHRGFVHIPGNLFPV